MKKVDEIFRRIEKGEASEEEMRVADDYLNHLDQRLSQQIDVWEKKETTSSPGRSKTVWLRRAVAAAACFLLVVSATLWFNHSNVSPTTAMVQKDTFDNPEDAAEEAEIALVKFSEAINKAICYNTK